jgi:DUF971 family protein
MSDPAAQAISVDVETDVLVVVWTDEHESRFELEELRRNCSCAECREARERGSAIWPRPGAPKTLNVTGAELAGAWGLSLRWNDGHDTGIYRWETLRSWCACELCNPT